MKTDKNIRFRSVLIVVTSVCIAYTYFIFRFNGFMGDDFGLFGLIKSRPDNFISFNIQDPFYLFFRPFSYFTHWLDFQILGLSAVEMKYVSVSFACVLGVLFYLLQEEILIFFRIQISNSILIVTSIFALTNLVTVISVIWISERNQLLMTLMYVLSIFSFFKYLNGSKNGYLFIMLVSFVGSLLSKQQSVHLPFLLLATIIIFRKRIEYSRLRKIKIALFLSVFVSIIAIIFFSFYQDLYLRILIYNLWKKPFFYFISIVYVLFPYIADNLYLFFVENKIFTALILSVLLLSVMIFINKIPRRRNLFFFIVIYMIAAYPVIFLSVQARLLELQVMILSLLLSSILPLYAGRKISTYIIALLTILSFAFTCIKVVELEDGKARFTNDITKINNLFEESGKRKLLFLNNNYLTFPLPYQMYYEKYGSFEKYDNVYFTPLAYNPIKSFDYSHINDSSVFTFRINKDTVTVFSNRNDIVLNTLGQNELVGNWVFDIADAQKSNLKGYKSISLHISGDFNKDEYLCLLYNGRDWIKVEL